MSAWAQLVHWDGSDEFLELCNAALLEVQRETSHRNAEKIRDDSWSRRDRWGRYENESRERGYAGAADLIDPEVTP